MKKFLFIMMIAFSFLQAEEGTFLLLLGPSGAGKSTLIKHLKKMDSRFVYVSPYTTRELRPGETDKIHVDLKTIQDLEQEGKLLTVNVIYGIYYATPKEIIDTAIKEGNIPVLDWPISKMDIMTETYNENLLTIYVEPESLAVLESHLNHDGRDKEGKRLAAAKEELEKYFSGEYDEIVNCKIVNIEGKDREAAEQIYQIVLDNQ